jgi:hypothetical protein
LTISREHPNKLGKEILSLAHLWASPIVKHEAKVIMKLNIRRSQRPKEGEGSYDYSLRVGGILCHYIPPLFKEGLGFMNLRCPLNTLRKFLQVLYVIRMHVALRANAPRTSIPIMHSFLLLTY